VCVCLSISIATSIPIFVNYKKNCGLPATGYALCLTIQLLLSSKHTGVCTTSCRIIDVRGFLRISTSTISKSTEVKNMLMWQYIPCVRYFMIILLRDVPLEYTYRTLTSQEVCYHIGRWREYRKRNFIWHSLQNIFDLHFKHYGQLAREFIFSGTIFRAKRSRDRLGGDELWLSSL
jgi:hypothetical protein